jgi:serine/threonine-protein kinase
MILADGGNVLLTGQSDRFTTAKWEGVLGTRDLDGVEPRDFEVITLGEVFAWDGDCAREG